MSKCVFVNLRERVRMSLCQRVNDSVSESSCVFFVNLRERVSLREPS